MPVENGVGWGPHTEIKMQHLRDIMVMHIAVTQAVMNKNGHFRSAYHYIDATAGPGILPELKLKGSPLLFLELAEDAGLSHFCDFIELRQCNCDSLKSNLPNTRGKVRVLHGDYAELLPKFVGYDRLRLGLIFVDPSGSKPYFDVLARTAKCRPAMELLFYLSATTLKRIHHMHAKRLSDYIQMLDKKYWLVREPIPDDPHQFTFLLGSNSQVFSKDYKKIDLYRLNSETAQRFFPRLNFDRFTIKKKKGQVLRMNNNSFKLVSSGKAPPENFRFATHSKWRLWHREIDNIPLGEWREYEFATGRDARLAQASASAYAKRVSARTRHNGFVVSSHKESIEEDKGPAKLFIIKQQAEAA